MDEASSGRIYDVKLARFMQADPKIDGAGDTQGYNRYSYVHNNPLNATDPSGFFSLKQFVGAIVAIVATVVLCTYAGCAGVDKVWVAMVAGAAGGAAQAAVNGTNILTGAITGAIGGAFGAGNAFIAGLYGGFMAYTQGGNFASGFFAAGIGAAGGGQGYSIDSFIRSTVLGGVASRITGGKFANGAQSAAFMFAVSAGMNKIGVGGTTYDIEGDPNVIDEIPDDPEKTYQEGLALAKDNPYVDGADRAKYVDKIKIGKCVSVDKCTQKRSFTSNAEAKKFMQDNKGWAQILGENSGSNTWIYRGATASGTKYFSDEVSSAKRISGVGCGCTKVTGAERVLSSLAHEGGHYMGLGHTPDLYSRELHSIEYSRRLIK
jgi:hypothetical protein